MIFKKKIAVALFMIGFGAFSWSIEAGSAKKRFFSGARGGFSTGKKVFGKAGAFLGTLGLGGLTVSLCSDDYVLIFPSMMIGAASLTWGGVCGIIALYNSVGDKISKEISTPHRLSVMARMRIKRRLFRRELPFALGSAAVFSLTAGTVWGIWRMLDQSTESKKS